MKKVNYDTLKRVRHFSDISYGTAQREAQERHAAMEKIAKQEKTKKLFLDLLASQTLLTSEYKCLLTNQLNLPKSVFEQIIIESKGCENLLNEQIKA